MTFQRPRKRKSGRVFTNLANPICSEQQSTICHNYVHALNTKAQVTEINNAHNLTIFLITLGCIHKAFLATQTCNGSRFLVFYAIKHYFYVVSYKTVTFWYHSLHKNNVLLNKT